MYSQGYSVRLYLSMGLLDLAKRIPVDLGQGHYRHHTRAKTIAYALAGAGAGREALDVGAGDGFWARELEKQNWKVVAIDNFDFRYPKTRQVDFERPLPFPDHSFDLVWGLEVIEHAKNVQGLAAEMQRVLRPGGLLIITTPNSSFWLYTVLRAAGIRPADVQNADHKQFFSLADIRALFPRAEVYGFFPYNLVKLRIRRGVGLLSPTFIAVLRS